MFANRHVLISLCSVSIVSLISYSTATNAVKYRRIPGGVIPIGSSFRYIGDRIERSSKIKCAGKCDGNIDCRGFVFDSRVCDSGGYSNGMGLCQLVHFDDPTAVILGPASSECRQFYVRDPCFGDTTGPCLNRGVCNVEWWPSVCQCKMGYDGCYCEIHSTTTKSALLDTSPDSCAQLLATNSSATSGEYTIRTTAGHVLNKVYCDMTTNGGGYTFINPVHLAEMTEEELLAMYTDNQTVMLQLIMDDGTQRYGVLAQLPDYSNYAMKIGLNESRAYTSPVNAGYLGSFLFFGFIPADVACVQGTTQGLTVNGEQLTFSNCDGNPNSYIALFPNINRLTPYSYYGGGGIYTELIYATTPSFSSLPVTYFMFVETHWGGCGTYAQSGGGTSNEGVSGAAIGFR